MHVNFVKTAVRSKKNCPSMLFDIGILDGGRIHVVSQKHQPPPPPDLASTYPPL